MAKHNRYRAPKGKPFPTISREGTRRQRVLRRRLEAACGHGVLIMGMLTDGFVTGSNWSSIDHFITTMRPAHL